MKQVPSTSSYPRCCPKTEEESKEVAARFSSRWNYHNCKGVVDSQVLTLTTTTIRASIVLMSVVDASHKFLYVDVGGASDGGTWSNDVVEENIA